MKQGEDKKLPGLLIVHKGMSSGPSDCPLSAELLL
jgi:hypothetical protein